jgi:hypothetical protein
MNLTSQFSEACLLIYAVVNVSLSYRSAATAREYPLPWIIVTGGQAAGSWAR